MISFIRKFVFAGKTKSTMAPHIFVVLCFYTAIVSTYTGFFFSTEETIMRAILSVLIVVSYTIFEKSKAGSEATAFLAPFTIVAILIFGAIFFKGDFLLFTYSVGTTMISLTYLKPKATAIYIIAISVPIAVIMFVFSIPLLGDAFSPIHTILYYVSSVALNSLIYIFCKSYARTIAALTEAKNEASLAAQAKGTFLSTMSHEIRTPMNAIIGMTNIGLAADSIERKQSALDKISGASTHLLGIINDILDMSKIEAGKLELAMEGFNFEETLQRVADVMSIRFEEKKQDFALYLDEKIPTALVGDDQRLAQVIANLLGNAVKFTPAGGAVRLNADLKEEEGGICTIQFEVVDSGIGISPEQQIHLFESFQQAEATTSRRFGGTGLGLAISKNIVEAMGGSIWVESELGKGSVFTFTIRMKRDARRRKRVKGAVETKPVVLTGRHMLLAEDMEINREIVITLLEPTEIAIDWAENGIEVVRMFNEAPEKYDVIFMDIQMPEMDGYEATRLIRESGAPNAKSIPIIALTADVFKEEVDKCIESGMDGHIGKPLDFNEVMRVLGLYFSGE